MVTMAMYNLFVIGLYTVDVTVAKNRSTRKASWEDTYTSYEAYT